MATEDARYRESSQYQLWSFSPTQLAAMREKTNAAARASIAGRLASMPPRASTPALPEFLTPAEEALLVTFNTSELLRAGDHAEMSDEIKATAAAFFRRFYVTNSIMTYPPTEMLMVALYFACKAEGVFLSITDFIKTFGRENPEEIIAGEFLLCQGLRFAIDVKHPFRALRGSIMELSALPDIEPARLAAAEHRAREILRFSPLITDAYFHYTPSQIMLAALSLADRGLAERLIAETFHYVAPPANNSGADTPASSGPDAPAPSRRSAPRSDGEDRTQIIGSHIRDKVLGTIEACRDMLSKELPERREHWTNKTVIKAQITPLRKKLNKCHDPERWNLVELQRARREQASKKADSEDGDAEDGPAGGTVEADGAVFGGPLPRDSKRRKVGKGLDDPFGPAL
ncbi:cyclin-like protein [Chaetomium strumarium]|uniref:Cyclin-like protein n=1 Tax=Chaetomium strumarium TaxID=1170767 RepID=A0AAJ0GYB6_9PEZI|nr:cyclin-like protein [Chaetomium strumarium]